LRIARLQIGVALVLALLAGPVVRGQNPDTMDPDRNLAKAKLLLKQSIAGMGGVHFEHNTGSQCSGRVAQFDHNGTMAGYTSMRSYWEFPDKNRLEYEVKSTKGGIFAVLIGNLPIKGGLLIQLFSGDKGWSMDKGGVEEAPVTAISDFQQAMKRQLHNILLSRATEEGVYLRFGGSGIVDLRQVEWVEISDPDGGNLVRVALDRSTHVPLRTVAKTANEDMNQMDEDVTIYSNYEELQGVQTPLQITREHNGHRSYQIFYDSCQNNPSLPADFFTKASLDKVYAEKGGKKKDRK
jgi:hypothetical protein